MPSVVVRDSSAVRVVENGWIDGAEEDVRLASSPLFRVGWDDEGPTFQRIVAGVVMDGDRFAVAEQAVIRVFSAEGEELYSIGRQGEGPGEFATIFGVSAAGGDTLLVHDLQNIRVTTFAGPELVTTDRVIPPVADHRHIVTGRSGEGEFILVPTAAYPVEGPSGEWHQVPILRYRRGSGMDTLIRLDYQVIGRRDLFAPSGQSAVSKTAVVHARADRPSIRWYGFDGSLVQIARWQSDHRAVSDTLWSWIEERAREVPFYQEMSDTEFQERVESWREGAQGPVPGFSRLFTDTSGNVWLEEWTPFGRRAARYLWVGSGGAVRGWLEVPEGFLPLAFTETFVLGVERDALDVPAAVAYRIEDES